MVKCYITYVLSGPESSSCFGHAFLMLSKQIAENGALEVVNTLGFYSQKLPQYTNPLDYIRRSLTKYYLQGGHGQFKHENMYEINHRGNTGISFAITQKQFDAHNDKFNDLVTQDATRIQELNTKISAGKQTPNAISRWEQAQRDQRDNCTSHQLRPFNVNIVNYQNSNTCKQEALQYLRSNDLITEAEQEKYSDPHR